MAITKVISVKVNINACVKYVTNEKKTDEQTLVSSYACTPKNAEIAFQSALRQTNKKKTDKPNLAYHFIQSFSPDDNVTPETAHKAGQEYIDNLLGKKFAYVMSTHIDKGHIHNHFIVCAAECDMSGKKMENDRSMIHKMIRESNKVCEKYNLKQNEYKRGRGENKQYKEWLEDKENPKGSHRTQIKKLINETIKEASSMEDFFTKLKEKGVQIKEGNTKKTESGKYLSFYMPEWENEQKKPRALRDYNLDKRGSFTYANIEKRISRKLEIQQRRNEEKEERKNNMSAMERAEDKQRLKTSKMFETNVVGASRETVGLEKWKSTQNSMLAMEILNKAKSKYGIENGDFRSKIAEIDSNRQSISNNLAKENFRAEQIKKLITNCQLYKDLKIYDRNYQRAENQEAYFEKHDTKLLAYQGAAEELEAVGVDLSKINNAFIKELQAKLDELEESITEKESRINQYEQERAEIEKMQREIDKYLGNDRERKKDELE